MTPIVLPSLFGHKNTIIFRSTASQLRAACLKMGKQCVKQVIAINSKQENWFGWSGLLTSTSQNILQRQIPNPKISATQVYKAVNTLSETTNKGHYKGGHLFSFVSMKYCRDWAAKKSICLVLPERPEWLLIPQSWPEAAEGSVRSPILLLSPAYLPPCQPHGAFSSLSSSFCLPPSPSANPL